MSKIYVKKIILIWKKLTKLQACIYEYLTVIIKQKFKRVFLKIAFL